MIRIVGVKFKDTGKIYHFDPADLPLKVGMDVIVDTARGLEYGQIASPIADIPDEELISPLKKVVRVATAIDKRQVESNRRKEKEAFSICLEKIEKHHLEMKLIRVEYSFDANKILFYFTANGRVDFRELVKDLAGVFRTRIELRQVGVRDESKMMGGLCVCGRPLCCSTFLSDFQPVSIKMAKEQGLSLNPTKISGTCGRLMCCLKYEQDCYEELHKTTPGVGALVKTPRGNGTVVQVAILSGKLKVRLDGAEDGIIADFTKDDVKLLRRGHHRNDKDRMDDKDMAELKKLEE
ncbi:MAG: stage 0 sporulation family protein [Clostridia bacterium]|nr:stage 0 sporulation protein [Oscillospiraceae bacterium]MBQ7033334.1 stage 0 sporulation family protein [Clostridia bacterium]